MGILEIELSDVDVCCAVMWVVGNGMICVWCRCIL